MSGLLSFGWSLVGVLLVLGGACAITHVVRTVTHSPRLSLLAIVVLLAALACKVSSNTAASVHENSCPAVRSLEDGHRPRAGQGPDGARVAHRATFSAPRPEPEAVR
jgi:hypothetical protein